MTRSRLGERQDGSLEAWIGVPSPQVRMRPATILCASAQIRPSAQAAKERHRTGPVRKWPKIGRNRATLGRTRATMGRCRSKLAAYAPKWTISADANSQFVRTPGPDSNFDSLKSESAATRGSRLQIRPRLKSSTHLPGKFGASQYQSPIGTYR